MKKCINCGVLLDDHAKFCHRCGTKQEKAPQQTAPAPQRETSWQDVPPVSEDAPENADEMSRDELIERLRKGLPATQQLFSLTERKQKLKKSMTAL